MQSHKDAQCCTYYISGVFHLKSNDLSKKNYITYLEHHFKWSECYMVTYLSVVLIDTQSRYVYQYGKKTLNALLWAKYVHK